MNAQDDFNKIVSPLKKLRKEFQLIVEPHRPALWQYCKMITGNPWDTEDLVQETLMKTYASLSQLVQPMIPKAYLFRIATNTWLNQVRKQNRMVLEEETIIGVEDADPFETREAIEMLVKHLSPKQRVVILLFDVFNYTTLEVAEMIGTTEGSVKALLHRARVNLKKMKEIGVNKSREKGKVVHNEIIEAYIEAFNKRDPDAIARLMDEQVLNDIVHVSKEYGIDIVRNHSLEGWSRDPMPMTAAIEILWEKQVIIVMGSRNGERFLYDLIELDIEDGLIVKKKDYYYCQDLLVAAGNEIDVPVHLNGYLYMGKDDM